MKRPEELLHRMLDRKQGRSLLQLRNERLKLSMLEMNVCIVILQAAQQRETIRNHLNTRKQDAVLLGAHLRGQLAVDVPRTGVGDLCIKRHGRADGPNDSTQTRRASDVNREWGAETPNRRWLK